MLHWLVSRWLLALGLLATSIVPASAVTAVPAQAQAQATWAFLGPDRPGSTGKLGLSRGWLRDGVIVAPASREWLMRTRDGGESWERRLLPPRDGSGYDLWAADGPSRRVTFLNSLLYTRGYTSGITVTLYRSLDDGDTWEQVWTQATTGSSALYPSPASDVDGTLFVSAGRTLIRSTDAGRTWEHIDQTWQADPLPSAVNIAAVTLSPSFGTDRTLLLDLQRNGSLPKDAPPDTIGGPQLSTDAGTTWRPLGVPTRAGSPYPRFITATFSPSYAEDGTLFVISSGLTPKGDGPKAEVCLFRSTDRGQTWEALRDVTPFETAAGAADVRLVLSPAFATDHTALLGLRVPPAPRSGAGQCMVERSADAGATWGAPTMLGTESLNYVPCWGLDVRQGPNGIVALGYHSVSYDLGQTWQELVPPDGITVGKVQFSPGFVQDDTLFVTSNERGVWAYGSRTKPAAGSIGCPFAVAEGLNRPGSDNPWRWGTIGCPTEPATPAHFVVDTSYSYGRGIWLSPTYGVRLIQAPNGPSTTPGDTTFFRTNELETKMTFPAKPDEEMDGFVQRFETGSLWAMFGPNGAIKEILVLEGIQGGRYHYVTIR